MTAVPQISAMTLILMHSLFEKSLSVFSHEAIVNKISKTGNNIDFIIKLFLKWTQVI
jgi:hypothetical protein